MAVLLCRSDGKPAVPSLDQKKHPKIIIRNDPLISAASHRGKRVVNRSDNQYASEEQTREEAWRKAYERCMRGLVCYPSHILPVGVTLSYRVAFTGLRTNRIPTWAR